MVDDIYSCLGSKSKLDMQIIYFDLNPYFVEIPLWFSTFLSNQFMLNFIT